MKTLFLMRHAKSSWDEPDVADIDRPLNERGRRTAPFMGRLMAERDLCPEKVLCSPARRARETAELAVNAAGISFETEVVDEIYEASTGTLARTVAAIDDRHASAMILGHNPGMEGLVAYLTGQTVSMPTAALAIIRLDIDSWSKTEERCGQLEVIIRPRDVMDE